MIKAFFMGKRVKINGLFLIILFGLGLFANVGCRPHSNKEVLQKMDSLDSYVNQATEILVIDDDVIRARRDSINYKINYLGANYSGPISEELEVALAKMKGIGKNYSKFLTKYNKIAAENEADKKRMENLRKDIVEGRLETEEFNKINEKEREILPVHLAEVKEAAQSVYLLENDYHRSSKFVQEFINVLERKNKEQPQGKK